MRYAKSAPAILVELHKKKGGDPTTILGRLVSSKWHYKMKDVWPLLAEKEPRRKFRGGLLKTWEERFYWACTYAAEPRDSDGLTWANKRKELGKAVKHAVALVDTLKNSPWYSGYRIGESLGRELLDELCRFILVTQTEMGEPPIIGRKTSEAEVVTFIRRLARFLKEEYGQQPRHIRTIIANTATVVFERIDNEITELRVKNLLAGH